MWVPPPAACLLPAADLLIQLCCQSQSVCCSHWPAFLVIAGDCAALSPNPCPAGKERVAISSLMAVGHVHHHLVTLQKRSRVGLLVETAEAREVRRSVARWSGWGASWGGDTAGLSAAAMTRIHRPPYLPAGAPLLPAAGLWRGRGVPLPRLRDAGGAAGGRPHPCQHRCRQAAG